MTEAESTAQRKPTAVDFDVPALEIRYDSFEEFLEQAGDQLLRSRIILDPEDDLAIGDLEHLVIRVCDQPALIRALGRVEEAVDGSETLTTPPQHLLRLIYIDPASQRLIDSIRQRHPELRMPQTEGEDDREDTQPPTRSDGFTSAGEAPSGAQSGEAPDGESPDPAVSSLDSKGSRETAVEWELDVESLIDDALPDPILPIPDPFDDLGQAIPSEIYAPWSNDETPNLDPEAKDKIDDRPGSAPSIATDHEKRIELSVESVADSPSPSDLVTTPPPWASPNWQPPKRVPFDENPPEPDSSQGVPPSDSHILVPDAPGDRESPTLHDDAPNDAPEDDALQHRDVSLIGEDYAAMETTASAASRWRRGLLPFLGILVLSLGAGFLARDRGWLLRQSPFASETQPLETRPLETRPLETQSLETENSPESGNKEISAPVAEEPAPLPDHETEASATYAGHNEEAKLTIQTTLEGWALAWSEQNFEAFIGFYISEYSPHDLDRATWLRDRKARIETPQSIEVSIAEMEIETLADDRAIARIFQIYEANSTRRATWKTFELNRSADGWKIHRETLGRDEG